jgi:hypothetical protein
MASLTVLARWYSNGAGTCMSTPRVVSRQYPWHHGNVVNGT